MTVDQTANFVRDSVASSIGGADTTISVDDASIYPDPANGNYNLVLWDFDEYRRPDLDPDVEIVRVTGQDTTNDTLSVNRGQEGTSAVSHPATSELQLAPTSKIYTDIDSKITSDLSITGSNGLNGGSAELGGSIDVSISGNLSLNSDLEAADGETIWDESATYIPQGRLENDSITVAGNSVSLGTSTAINHSNISNISSDDHHTKYTNSEAISAVESANPLSLQNDLNMANSGSIQDAGTDAISFDGSQNVEIPNGILDVNGDGTSVFGTTANSQNTAIEVQSNRNWVDIDFTSGNYGTGKLGWHDGSWKMLSGDVSIPDGNLNFSNSHSIQDSGTDAISFDGSANVTVPNGNLYIATGQSIRDSGGEHRVNLLTSRTRIHNEDGNTQIDARGDNYLRLYSRSNEPIDLYDLTNDQIGVQFQTGNPGTLSFPNANLSLPDGIQSLYGTNDDFSIFYENASDELVVKDESNGVELIRQPKSGSTQFLQGVDIGSIEAPEDSLTQIINTSSTSSATSGDTVGYTLSVDNRTGFKVFAESDGSGGLSRVPVASATKGLNNATYATKSDVPSNLPEGTQVYIEDTNTLFMEDGS